MAEPLLTQEVGDWAIIEKDGVRIGLISALATDTPETSSPGPTVLFQDERGAARTVRMWRRLGRGVNINHRADPCRPAPRSGTGGGRAGDRRDRGRPQPYLMANGVDGAVPYPAMVGSARW